MRLARAIAIWGLGAALAAPALAQQDRAPAPGDHAMPPMVVEAPPREGDGILPVMTLDQELLYSGSKWGQRALADLERRRREIEAENDRLATQFSSEEQELSSLRQSLPADEFRKRADEFDKRVVEVRRARDVVVRELQEQDTQERQSFFRAALPVLAALMRERGAVAVLDQRAIFVASQSIDVTTELTARIDQEIGAGPLPEEPAKPDGRATPAPATPAPAPDPAGAPQQ